MTDTDHNEEKKCARSYWHNKKSFEVNETINNLKFEDPFVDEFEKENIEIKDDVSNGYNNYDIGTKDSDDFYKNMTDVSMSLAVKSWNPLIENKPISSQKLEINEAAYKMHHSLTPEWPSLSFDILHDLLGSNRTRFPHSLVAVVGSQANRRDKNKLSVLKFSELGGTVGSKSKKSNEDELLGPEYYRRESESEDDSYESDCKIDLEPVLEHFSIPHLGVINRVRAMPDNPEIVAAWSDIGSVNLYDISGILENFELSSPSDSMMTGSCMVASGKSCGRKRINNYSKINRSPFFVYSGHSIEGYAMNWSKISPGNLATGDCDGNIHLWNPSCGSFNDKKVIWNNSAFNVSCAYSHRVNVSKKIKLNVEDIQWSPTEATVLAAAGSKGYISIYDTRCHGKPMLNRKLHMNGVDVNVISWNSIATNLLASGGDDGTFSVWDLRTFQTNLNNEIQPVARFTCHKNPITSLEWHPTDESMIVVSDENATYVYDLSVEEDNDIQKHGLDTSRDCQVPSQMLFIHCGSESTKEVHWHPQITSLIMTTSLSGYSVFIPSNL